MGKWDKLYLQIITGNSDSNIAFDDLCHFLERNGFKTRTKGSHTVFTRFDVVERINLQRDGSKAKPYQVKQVRAVTVKYNLKGAI